MDGRIVYMCRGHGFGHAAHAKLLIDELARHVEPARIQLASSDTGYKYFVERSVACVDLEIADEADHSAAAVARGMKYLLEWRDAELVISDELFYVPRLCSRYLDIPCVFISHAFGHELDAPELDGLLAEASRIILVDWPELHTVPGKLAPLVTAVGPLVDVPRMTKSEARHRLGLDDAEFVGVATFGAILPAKRPHMESMLKRLLDGWKTWTGGGRLILLVDRPQDIDAGGDLAGSERVCHIGHVTQPGLFYSAADVVFTLGGTSLLEALRAGTPTVAFAGLPWESSQLEHVGRCAGVGIVRERENGTRAWALARAVMSGGMDLSSLTFAEPGNVADIVLSCMGRP